MNWHILDTDEVLQKTGSSNNGLTQDVVEQKLQEFGQNKLAEKKKKPV
jgi:hypothetical protein